MAKKRKNSNYVTEKRMEALALAEKKKKEAAIKKIVIPIIITVAVIALIVGLVFFTSYAVNHWGQNFTATHHATIEIEGYGTVHLELYGNEAPKTVENFVKLANAGYYEGSDFHRIIKDFMAQGGDSDEPCDTIFGEFKSNGFDNPIKHRRGVISMARAEDKNSASSQFFIVHKTSSHLDGEYAAFGKVTDGMDVIDAICENVKYGYNGAVDEADRPVIKSITIHESH